MCGASLGLKIDCFIDGVASLRASGCCHESGVTELLPGELLKIHIPGFHTVKNDIISGYFAAYWLGLYSSK